MECVFIRASLKSIICQACGKQLPLPRDGRFDNLRVACSGHRGPLGHIKGSVDLTGIKPPKASGGPGTELKAVNAEIGIIPTKTCSCNKIAADMDNWGVEGCRARYDHLVGLLREGSANWGWAAKLKAGFLAVKTGLAFKLNPLDPYPGLLDEALRRAAERESPPPALPGIGPFTGPVTRNLLMFIYPRRTPEWRRNLEYLFPRLSVFNGKKIFAIATDTTTDTFEAVVNELEAVQGGEAIHVDNNIGEIAGFGAMLARVKTDDPNEITFYCHAKGVTKKPNSDQLPFVRKWYEAMYEVCLDDIEAVQAALTNKTFAGAFRAIGRQFPMDQIPFQNWHYPGTFYWFRSAEIFANPRWSNLPLAYFATEAWPGIVCPVEKSKTLLIDHVPLASLYTAEYWQSTVTPALNRWRARQLETAPK